MRGFRIGDFLQTKNGLHKGIVIKIETVDTDDGLRFYITINENNELYTDDIDNFYIF